MEPGARNRFGRADLEVTAFGFGPEPVGNIFREIDERLRPNRRTPGQRQAWTRERA